MKELVEDRAMICDTLQHEGCEGWAFEIHAEARSVSIRRTYLEELANCDFYIGIFYRVLGSATREEFEYARSAGKPLLIFEKLADPGERTPELDAFLSGLNDIDMGITARKYHGLAELAQAVRTSVARLLADRFHASARFTLPASTPVTRHRELNELAKLRHGVVLYVSKGLSSPLVPMPGLEPTRVLTPRLVRPVAAETGPDEPDQELPPAQGMAELFQRSNESLLIAGGPGSGKTMALLELADQLMPPTEKLAESRLPVLVPLSLWTRHDRDFAAWLAQTIAAFYSPAKFLTRWIKQGRLVFLLDGLDEVPAAHRAACIETVNQFAATTGAAIGLTCRLHEYAILAKPLRLNLAVTLQPLEAERIHKFLAVRAATMTCLRTAIASDEMWLELAQSPLLLSVMISVYDRLTAEQFESPRHQTREARRAFLWDRYLQKRIERKPGRFRETGEQIRSGLHWLARQMSRHSQVSFFLEYLQPSWLNEARHRWVYAILTRAGAAAVAALGIWALILLSLAFSSQYREQVSERTNSEIALFGIIIILAGLAAGVIRGFSLGVDPDGQPSVRGVATRMLALGVGAAGLALLTADQIEMGFWLWVDASFGFLFGLALYPVWRGLMRINRSVPQRWRRNAVRCLAAFTFGCASGLVNAAIEFKPENRVGDLIGGAVIGLLLGIVSRPTRKAPTDIRVFEAARWSWTRASLWALASVLVCVLAVVVLIFGDVVPSFFGFWRFGFWYGLWFGVPLSLIGFFLGGWTRDDRIRKIQPNEGMLMTMRSTALGAGTGGVLGVALGIFWQLVSTRTGVGMNSNAWESIREGLMLGPAFAMCFALLAGLGKGGAHLQRHYPPAVAAEQ